MNSILAIIYIFFGIINGAIAMMGNNLSAMAGWFSSAAIAVCWWSAHRRINLMLASMRKINTELKELKESS